MSFTSGNASWSRASFVRRASIGSGASGPRNGGRRGHILWSYRGSDLYNLLAQRIWADGAWGRSTWQRNGDTPGIGCVSKLRGVLHRLLHRPWSRHLNLRVEHLLEDLDRDPDPAGDQLLLGRRQPSWWWRIRQQFFKRWKLIKRMLKVQRKKKVWLPEMLKDD